MDIILTRKIKVGVFVPTTITNENERKEYKNFAWNLLRKVNQQNFEFHNLLIKKLIEIDAILQSKLVDDSTFIQIRNEYYSGYDKSKQKLYFDYIKQKRNDIIESYGYKNLSAYIYNYLVAYIKGLDENQQYINSYTYCAISKNVTDKYLEDLIDVNRGNKNVAFYKNNQPIPINIKAPTKIDENGIKSKNLAKEWFNKYDKDYTFRFKSIKKHELELTLYFGRDKSNNRIMVDRLYNGDPNYKLCDSKIQIVDNEIFLLLSIKQFNVEANKTSDPNKILGVDLGVKCAAYVATNNSMEKKQIGDKDFALLKVKLAMEKDKKLAQRNSIFSKSGHGRKRKLQKLNDLRETEKNFRNTFNHRISAEIIKTAISWNCGQINVEDLSFLKENNERLLRNWTYFDLLSKIEYKAKKNGIQFLKVNPRFTSQTCKCCGERGNRTKRDVFICTNPDCTEFNKHINADYNAAVNIAKNINQNNTNDLEISIF